VRRIIPRKPEIQFIRLRWVWFGISALLIIISIISLSTRGIHFGIDFTGGTELDIQSKQGTTLSQVRGVMGKFGFSSAQIQEGKNATFIIRTPRLTDQQKTQIQDALKKDAGLVAVQQINDVGPGWGAQVSRQAIIALIVFIIAVLIYISFRFEFKMAVCAIIEIVHDFIITVGVYSLFAREVTPATVIAVLTILGYSLYDTVVVFDRIKENADQLTRQSKKTYSETVNDSVNQVLTRSINTSLTSLIPIMAILVFGGATLQTFAFALFIGILAGTYSSIFLAPPILAMLKETEPKYKAYTERIERKQTRAARVPVRQAEGAAAVSAAAGVGLERETARAVAQPSATVEDVSGKTARVAPKKPAAAAGQKPSEKPVQKVQPKPKPTAKTAGAAGKSEAKNRTKGPGSGKKKKKKK
jgi:preprotein translocase subunit SecF